MRVAPRPAIAPTISLRTWRHSWTPCSCRRLSSRVARAAASSPGALPSITPTAPWASCSWDRPSPCRTSQRCRRCGNSTISRLTDPIDRGFVRGIAESTLAQPVPPAFLEAMVQENLKVPARVWRATMEGLLEDDSFRELEKIKVPTLIIWGDRDSLLTRSDQEALAAAIPDSRLVVYAGAGHACYWEEPARVASDLVAFVKLLGG